MRFFSSCLRHVQVQAIHYVRTGSLGGSHQRLHQIGEGDIIVVQKYYIVRLGVVYRVISRCAEITILLS